MSLRRFKAPLFWKNAAYALRPCVDCRCYSNAKVEEYDLLVIGGGSGGLACAKEAVTFNKRVAVLDYVKPSEHGSKWGLGGTCVNVGCIPKKLMHQGALLGQLLRDANAFGWTGNFQSATSDWQKLCQAIQDYVRSLNWGHRVQLNDNKVTYINAYGSFMDASTVRAVGDKGEKVVRAKHIVLATGLRPKYPEIPGAQEGITSDDLFSLPYSPGKVLVVGGSYVALECAGFLSGLGHSTTTMIRSIPLRGFDQQMAEMVVSNLQVHKVKVIRKSIPTRVSRQSDGLLVDWSNESGENFSEKYNTILWAIGRHPRLDSMNVSSVGIKLDHLTGKVVVDEADRSSVSNVYAIGDIQHGKLELTPVAIRAGKLLARRLFDGSEELMSYENVPTTIFTPVEYSCVGLSEEDAADKYGAENLEVYHSSFKPLEYALPHRVEEKCYAKVICHRAKPNSVVGIHYLGPNAGEIMQGFAVGLRCGMNMENIASTLGIHPTCAEEMVKLKITKRSGKNADITGC